MSALFAPKGRLARACGELGDAIMSGSKYLLRRLMLSVLVILGVLLVTFMVSRVIPGDPARLYVGKRAGEAALIEAREQLGLNDPLPLQFVRYVWSSARGDFGYS